MYQNEIFKIVLFTGVLYGFRSVKLSMFHFFINYPGIHCGIGNGCDLFVWYSQILAIKSVNHELDVIIYFLESVKK